MSTMTVMTKMDDTRESALSALSILDKVAHTSKRNLSGRLNALEERLYKIDNSSKKSDVKKIRKELESIAGKVNLGKFQESFELSMSGVTHN